MDSLIHSDNTWALMSVMMAAVAASIYLEQRYRWASRVTGAVIAIVIALILVNTGVIPSSAPLYDDVVWGYIVPAAIPLLLFQTNIRKIWRETGQLLAIFIIGSFGTIAGAVIGCALLQNSIEGLPKVAAMMTGSYIGGSVNFAALADAFKVSGTLLSSAIVADNLNMAIYFLILLGVAGNAFVRRFYEHPLIDEVEEKGVSEEGKTLAAVYWGRKDVSLRDIAMCLTYTVIVVTVSKAIGGAFVTLVPPDGGWLAKMCSVFLGSQYVWLTVLSVGFASFFEKTGELHARCTGDRDTVHLYVLLHHRRSCIHHGDSDECTPASRILPHHGGCEYALLPRWGQDSELPARGHPHCVECEYRRADDGGGHGDLAGLDTPRGTCDAGRHVRLRHRDVHRYHCGKYARGINNIAIKTGNRHENRFPVIRLRIKV